MRSIAKYLPKMRECEEKFSIRDLIEILAIGGVLIAAIVAPNAIQGFKFILRDKNKIPSFNEFNRSRLRTYIKRLEERGVIKRKREKNQVRFILTEKGRKLARKYSVNDVKLENRKKWDKIWRVVIFDIPERKKTARDALRRKFLKLGMYQLQKSVFIYPYECKNEIDFVADFFGVGEDILYLHAKIADVDKKVKKVFDL